MSDANDTQLDQLEHEALVGEEARQLIENRLFKAAWDSAEADVLSQMQEVSYRDTEMHSRLVTALKILKTVRSTIEGAVETGKNATIVLSEPRRFGLWPRKS